jgi:tRNA(His) 5'-end guanylyltransferase
MSEDSLGDRMKGYETIPRLRLVPQMPVLARLDGKAFHTLTRGMVRPYDARFHECMWAAARHLCEQIQGVRVAYVQSDEITLLITQASEYTQPWFDNDLQKMCSVAASMAGVAFLDAFRRSYPERGEALPVFDARFWNLPEREVVNCFIWRQQDAVRNSIQMLAQTHFSHKQLHGVNTNQAQELLMTEKGINWNDVPIPQKRGVCLVREQYAGPEDSVRHRWVVDREIPTFTQDREYIERFLRAVEVNEPQSTGPEVAGG